MKRALGVIVSLLLTITPGDLSNVVADISGQEALQDIKTQQCDKESLQGAWCLVSTEIDGETSSELDGVIIKYVFSEKEVTLKFCAAGRDEPDDLLRYVLRPTRNPKEIDFVVLHPVTQEEVYKILAIYKLEGKRLTIVQGNVENDRPTAFKGTTIGDTSFQLWVFEKDSQ